MSTKPVGALSVEELRAEARDIKDAIFAYEMSGDTHRIKYVEPRQRAIYAELSKRTS